MRAGAWTGAVVAIAVASACVAARADEGMWLFSRPPLERIERDHAQALGGARLTPEWLLHLQQSSVRFNSGGSGSFVSADGLVLTNHHVGADSLQKLGDETHNYYRDGFAATSREEELRCPDLELNVLMSIEDVTSRVAAAVSPGMKAEDAFAARRKVMAEIEQESVASTGLRSDVVTLYRGGRYHLYRAKKYTDVRLVFAPEHQIAFFGGDADNFEFPRYNLDACFFRAYEDGQPARVPHHLAWSTKSVRAGDLVFVSGHPGHTDRASTVRELEAKRDRQVPFSLAVLNRLEVLYGAYAAEGPEARRQVMGDLFGVQNGRKNREGVLAGLLDPALMARKRAEESRLRDLVAKAADRHSGPSPFESIEEAEATIGRVALRHNLLEGAVGFNSQYFTNARTILRAAAESARPTGERLREYRDSNRGSLEQQLFSPEPLYDPLEIAKLADSLTFLATALGPDDPTVARVLAGKPPRERAAELVRGTRLGARATAAAADDDRRRLYEGGRQAVDASRDPMLLLAKEIDEEARGLRKIVETAGEVKRQAHAEIARAVFAADGESVYPDATFTLRLAYGTVKGYEQDGREVAPITTYAGLFARAAAMNNVPPFDLPPRWQRLRGELERDAGFLATPFNFVSTADIIGGNSGSPVVNPQGQLVGLIFDGNIQSLVLDLAYDDVRARAVSVDAAGILAALKRVYRADTLVAELLGGAASDGKAAGWRPLFDGRSLDGWKPTPFGGEGEVTVADGAIAIARGSEMSGIPWTNDVPRQDYEIALEARRVDGFDFFCGLTFPVGDDACSFIVGGWGGAVVGLSSIDGADASSNDTTSIRSFKNGRWYAVRVRVSPARIECFLDDDRVVDQPLAGRTLSIRDEVVPSKPLGIATYATAAEVRGIRWRPLGGSARAEEQKP
ncbi:MAG: S46 family peptidase [Planctomycetia bacterium]